MSYGAAQEEPLPTIDEVLDNPIKDPGTKTADELLKPASISPLLLIGGAVAAYLLFIRR